LETDLDDEPAPALARRGEANMSSKTRREFLQQGAGAGIACSAGLLGRGIAFGQTAQTASNQSATMARVYVDSRRTIGALDRNLFGSFLEHLGRAIYEGVYEPGSPLSDANGFRKDVLEEVRTLGVPIIRYPGGNFVSGYNWLDGVGPKKDRPRVLDKAWNTIDTNQFGTDEFMAWAKMVGARPLMGLNLGTGTPERAAALVEYCNTEKGTKWSDLRRSHGIEQPYKVEHWCLGNEMDGPWQIGHMTATEYGLKAQDAARQMHAVDRSLKLIACGSSGPAMPTYLEWDREVLEQCYEYVDALSLHRYIGNTPGETGQDSAKFVAMNLSMERQIAETLAVCDMVRGHKRSPKKLWLSFDEWNVWYRARDGEAMNGHQHEAPHLLEEVYNLEDALLVGGIVNSLMRYADRIKIACLAQLVNVIAPIATNAKGLLRQSIYYPYSWALQGARGTVLNALVDSPTYEVSDLGQVPYLDVAGTLSPEDRKISLFILNRDLVKAHTVEINWQNFTPGNLLNSSILTGTDLKAFNTFESPQRVAPQAFDKPGIAGGRTTFEVPARSYLHLQWGL
jgi:alpha-N-arabinofuranosidase